MSGVEPCGAKGDFRRAQSPVPDGSRHGLGDSGLPPPGVLGALQPAFPGAGRHVGEIKVCLRKKGWAELGANKA